MFAPVFCVLLWIFPILQYSGICLGEVLLPYLTLYSPGDPDYTEVIVRRVGDNLTLACELKGDGVPRIFVWNYVPSDNVTDVNYKPEPRGATLGSRFIKHNLQLSDSGHYICSAPEWRFSISKFILVQNRSGECAKGALWCGSPNNPLGRCVLAPYVCDGYRDCVLGEDEAPSLCAPNVCSQPDKLNCSSGRCISSAACCTSPALCRQPACCAEHPRYARLEGWGEPDYPALFEDRHAPDEYGFIQSTIYTVTACALIFMIAVVLLVSAICKMQMKRAALRSYTSRPVHAQLHTRQMPRFPPCYEASRLLEERGVPSPQHQSPLASPVRPPPQLTEEWVCNRSEPSESDQTRVGFGLARLSALFATRYRQVCTENPDVELRPVPPTSPHRRPASFLPYRSPTSCDLNRDFYFSPEVSECGRDLNYMGTPVRVLRERPRPLTLQLGRFQLSIPRLTRRRSLDRRPDTPNVTELNIEDIDFVRLNSNDTYTLNGRTIRLLGADFENYPSLTDTPRPPPYNESMRYKIFGPPPEYLSRDCLNETRIEREQQARSNVEMPPCYDELSVRANAGVGNAAEDNGNVSGHVGNAAGLDGNASGHFVNSAENNGNANGQAGNAAENNGYSSGHIGNAAGVDGNANGPVGNAVENNDYSSGHFGNAARLDGNAGGPVVIAAENVGSAGNVAESIGNAARLDGNARGHFVNSAENNGYSSGHFGNAARLDSNAGGPVVIAAENVGSAGNVAESIGNAARLDGNASGPVVNAAENVGSAGNVDESIGNAAGHIGNVDGHIVSAGDAAECIGNATEIVGNAAGVDGNAGNVTECIGNRTENYGNAAACIGYATGHIGIVNAAEHIDIGNIAANINVGNTSVNVGNKDANTVIINAIGNTGIGNAAENIGNKVEHIGNESGHIDLGKVAESMSFKNVDKNAVSDNTTANKSIVNAVEDIGIGNVDENAIRNTNENIVIGVTVQNTLDNVVENGSACNTEPNTAIGNTVENIVTDNTNKKTYVGNATENTGICNTTEKTGKINVIIGNTNENTINNNATSGNTTGNNDLNRSNAKENVSNIENNGDSVTNVINTTESHNGKENTGNIENTVKSDGNTVKINLNSVTIDLPAIDSDGNGTETCFVNNENNEIGVNNIEC